MKTLLLAALLLTGFVVLLPEATAHGCFEPGPEVNPDACDPRHWECYWSDAGIDCAHGP